MYVPMFTCMCVAADYTKVELQKMSRGCNITVLTMHYFWKKYKSVSSTSGHCPLPADFFFFWVVYFGPDKVVITQPTVNNTDCSLSHAESVR